MLGLEVTYTPFAFCPTVQAMAGMPFSEMLARFRDPEVRARILEEFKVPLEQRQVEIARAFDSRTVDLFSMSRFLTNFNGMFPLGDPPQYEPPAATSIAAIAALIGKEPAEIAYDALLAQSGRALIYVPAANFAGGNLDAVREMLAHKDTVLGLGDAGAHCGLICDASFPTYMMTHWARDRKERLPVQDVVHALTRQGAAMLGLEDRGLIAPGLRADINVIDLARLNLRPPEVVYDLPAGGKRLTQEADGYVVSIVKGVPTYREGQPTGALPGRLLRSGHALH
jgi:N-acyl-D-aspartate/D-glutamate deacylase